MIVKVHQCLPIYHPFPIASWLIKYFSKTNYSHYAIQCNNVVVDATGHDVLPRSVYQFRQRYRVEKTFELNIDTDFEGFVNWTLIYVNRKYSFLQVFGLLLMTLGFSKNNPWGNDDKRLICNELVLYLLADFTDFKPSDTDNYTLEQTEKVLRKYANWMILR